MTERKPPHAINPLQGAPGQATVWTTSFRTPARQPLRGRALADVCVVGAGSRFDAIGKVISGPANPGLAPIEPARSRQKETGT